MEASLSRLRSKLEEVQHTVEGSRLSWARESAFDFAERLGHVLDLFEEIDALILKRHADPASIEPLRALMSDQLGRINELLELELAPALAAEDRAAAMPIVAALDTAIAHTEETWSAIQTAAGGSP